MFLCDIVEVLCCNGAVVGYGELTVVVVAAVEAFLAFTAGGDIDANTHGTAGQLVYQHGTGTVGHVAHAVGEPLVHGPLVVGKRSAERVKVHGALLAYELLADNWWL